MVLIKVPLAATSTSTKWRRSLDAVGDASGGGAEAGADRAGGAGMGLDDLDADSVHAGGRSYAAGTAVQGGSVS
ncbi:MAG: hypothetical protein R2713_15870 [Ilumatobacteraceae bacterium]